MSLATRPRLVAPVFNPTPATNGADLLRQMGRMGLFQPGVPVSLGGHGGQLRDLCADTETARTVAALGPHAPQVFKAQRLGTDALTPHHP
jgi:alkylation response protein AidB-like acyl-CoA dehydrogenase